MAGEERRGVKDPRLRLTDPRSFTLYERCGQNPERDRGIADVDDHLLRMPAGRVLRSG